MARFYTGEHTMTGINTPSRDMKRREWEKLCTEVTRARERIKKIDEHVTWLVAYVRGSLPPAPPADQQHDPYAA